MTALLDFVVQGLRISIPYVLAGLGGLLCERTGVVNIALEGMLLVGAFAGTVAACESGSALAGIFGALAAGLALAALFGLATIRMRADQVVCGVAATLLAGGATRFFLKLLYHSASNSPRILAASATWPLVGATVALLVLVQLMLARSRLGLRLRTAGERPEAALALGISVARLRWFGVLCSGALGGLGGVWLAYDQRQFVAGMSAGRGYVALAAMILGGWHPVGVTLGCLLFGCAEALELRLQSASGVWRDVLAPGTVQALPYIITVVALVLRPRRVIPPAALGQPLGD